MRPPEETRCWNLAQLSVCGPSWTHQKLDLAHAEGVGAADVIGQPARRRYDHMWLVGELQSLAHHVCQQHNRGEAQTGFYSNWQLCFMHLIMRLMQIWRWKNNKYMTVNWAISAEVKVCSCCRMKSNESWLQSDVKLFTHSTDDDAVSQTQRLPQNSKLLCNLIGQLPAWHHNIISWKGEC